MLAAQLAIEPALAALAAKAGGPADWDGLQQLLDESVGVVDLPNEFNQATLAFCDAITALTANVVLSAALTTLFRIQLQHYEQLGSAATARAAVEEHVAIVAALRTGDGDVAAAGMAQHLELVRRRLVP